MFERFVKEARAVAVRAEGEAVDEGSETIEAEHLLLALTNRGLLPLDHDELLDALASERERSLEAVGVSTAGLPPIRPPRPSARRPRWGASAKLALERSLRAAQERGDRRIEPRHVLLGILRAEVGTVPRALEAAGLDRQELVRSAAP